LDEREDLAAPGVGAELRIVEWQNEAIVRGRLPFAYQTADPTLAQLRQQYHLDDVVDGAFDEFEQFLRLREWVHTRWAHGWNRTPPARSALEILPAAAAGGDFACGYYALTLMQCLLALGFVARLVSLSKTATEWTAADEGNVGHAVTEVWSHQYHKWVVLDADLNVHYERDGQPLNALEVHHAWVTRQWPAVRQLQGPTPYRMTEKRSAGYLTVRKSLDHHLAERWIFNRHRVGDYYAHVGIAMGNIHHSSDEAVPFVQWVDEWTPPRLFQYGRPGGDRWTTDEHDLYWTVDQVQIVTQADATAWAQGQAIMAVTLEHSVPNLGQLLVRTVHDEPWRATEASFAWPLRPGKNQIMAKAVNTFGREGHVSRILLRYHP
jgi:hypothetical protein